MVSYKITKKTRDEWVFGKALERILKSMVKLNPEAKEICATLRIDDTLWSWDYLSPQGKQYGKN